LANLHLPDWVTYPGEDWVQITPEEAGLDPVGFAAFLKALPVRGGSFGGEDHSNGRWGAVVTRGGYLVHTWGDRHYRYQTSSTGKAFIWALLGLAVQDGLIDPDQPINKSWTGEGELSHPHKYLTNGHHKTLTWRHVLGERLGVLHYGGFPMELGNRWREKRTGLEEADCMPGVPEWANWTGDPSFDLYSHAEPGTIGLYSSAGIWRLSQALTAVMGQDLKAVLDERLFGKIGIRPERWDWYAGGYVKDQKYFYPTIPDSYTYLDPPYEIDGHPVRSGPGWVVISASDLARFGHLIATQGSWEGEQLLDPAWLRGHGGGNNCGVTGESEHFTATAVVTTEGMQNGGLRSQWYCTTTTSFLPQELFVGPVT
jgi:CubicO group peptidase (beta-lactamase class C family)